MLMAILGATTNFTTSIPRFTTSVQRAKYAFPIHELQSDERRLDCRAFISIGD
jgi:hypothetical protein